MSRVLHNEKVKAISTLDIRPRLARSTKTYTTFTSCSNTFFSLASRLCSRGFCVLTEQINVILAACFTLRGHDTVIDFLWFLNFWSS